MNKHFPEISCSFLREIVTDQLKMDLLKRGSQHAYRRAQDQSQGFSVAVFSSLRAKGRLLDQIATGVETWLYHLKLENQRKSMEYHHPGFPTNPHKLCFPRKKFTASVFWDRKGLFLVDFMQEGTIINADGYYETLLKLLIATQNKKRGMLTRGIVLLHDNALPHIARKINDLIRRFQ